MQRKIEQLVSGQARKLAAPQHLLHFLLYSSNKHLQEDSKYVDLQVGKQVWFSVPRRMRQELWLSVLHKNRGAGAAAAKQYASLVRQALPEDVDADIEKDVGRTFPNAARFASESGKKSLLRVLRAYAVHDTEVGYCQGMNFLAGLLLTWMPNEATAFGGLVVLMQQHMLRDLYKSDLARLQVYLWQFGRLLPGKLGRHMEAHGVLPVLYLSSWLLTSFGSDFPLFFSSRVLDVVLTGTYPHAVLKVALALLSHCSKRLLALDDMEEIVHFLKAEVPNWSREDLQDILSDALSQTWTPAQEAILSNETGMETVIDAVGRITAAAQDNAAQLDEATQQAEHSSKAAAKAAPPRTPCRNLSASAAQRSTAQQQTGISSGSASPLPSMASLRSASWTARLRALPSSPSLPAACSPTPVDHARRHTTEDAAQPSLPDSTQHTGLGQTAINPAQPSSGPVSFSSSPNEHHCHSPAAASSPALNKEASAAAVVAAVSADTTDEADLLSFATDESDWHPGFESAVTQPQPLNGFQHVDSGLGHGQADALSWTAEPSTSTQLQDSQASQNLKSSWTSASASLHVPEEQSSNDPFQPSAAFSAELSKSSKHLSGLSMLADSQGSDLDSWGSFLLPDESANTMEDSMIDRDSGLADGSHSGRRDGNAVLEVSALSLSLPVNTSDQHVLAAEASPNACIASKQRVQLDLFLQSSTST